MFHVKHFGTIAEAFRPRCQVRGAARHRPSSAASTEAEARPSADKPDREGSRIAIRGPDIETQWNNKQLYR
jgi:hypothetical protein